MKFFYLHGYGGKPNPNNHNVIKLNELGDVKLIGYDSNGTYQEIFNEIQEQLVSVDELDDYIMVGISHGAYMASKISGELCIPFIGINPSISPYDSLSKKNVDQHVVDSYNCRDMTNEGQPGLILLDKGDELFDANQTIQLLHELFEIVTFKGGNHQFQHMTESLEHIKRFYNECKILN